MALYKNRTLSGYEILVWHFNFPDMLWVKYYIDMIRYSLDIRICLKYHVEQND